MYFSLQSEKKPYFSLSFALSEYDRRTLLNRLPGKNVFDKSFEKSWKLIPPYLSGTLSEVFLPRDKQKRLILPSYWLSRSYSLLIGYS
jgi:hypothetical protein